MRCFSSRDLASQRRCTNINACLGWSLGFLETQPQGVQREFCVFILLKAAEHLIHVFMCMPDHQERDLNFLENTPMNKQAAEFS